MKVLHVYSGNLFGGIERMLVAMAQLPPSLIQNTFALCFEARLATALRSAGANVERLPEVHIRRPVTVLKARRELRRLLRRESFDAIVCHSIWTYCVFASAVRRAGARPVLYQHDVPDRYNAYYLWASIRPPSLCIANSRYTAELVAQWRPSLRVEVVHPLVCVPKEPSADAVANLRTRLGAQAGDIVLLQASRLESWKGHRLLLRALERTRDLGTLRCWIAGTPQRPKEQTYLAELQALIAELGIGDRVRFIGHRDDIALVLAACDIYCQPNETPEPYGMVFVEAMALGKPVVACNVGGVQEIVSAECGELCPTDPARIADALRRIASDHCMRASMSVAALQRGRSLCDPRVFAASLQAALLDGRGDSSHHGTTSHVRP
jgi:glycosyltransferase involved in cell wall biosynthesis